ncbi:hypothetical protein PTSG_06270 [Salpingoeca rosetta]|uniref:Uncharacterized protein n=1 Tax=Salpingoeca rosetta (strain ATCC 50818 / BSB-021) TaxID=946362 RepID=F2UCF1_SALR5|nr:uncharacterized protein PTSG_06270 [Salpingoeca rosetta]EGD74258.1 hypothetical protein PTSG_06270 [Salpingoeca rosetta]|eukprot:XP_004993158.1 hypothetical protein PTSG_06270 [Salpingoeca rosetta]
MQLHRLSTPQQIPITTTTPIEQRHTQANQLIDIVVAASPTPAEVQPIATKGRPHSWLQPAWSRAYNPQEYTAPSPYAGTDGGFLPTSWVDLGVVETEDSASESSCPDSTQAGVSQPRARECMLTAHEVGRDAPGPGAYDVTAKVAYKDAGVALRGRAPEPTSDETPGPGQYAQSPERKQHHKRGAAIVGRTIVKRDGQVPGPADYTTSPGARATRLKRAPIAMLIGRSRSSKKQEKRPGPADYAAPPTLGQDTAPAFTLGGRRKETKHEKGPGPQTYATEAAWHGRHRRQPHAVLASRRRQQDHPEGPGAGKYHIGTAEEALRARRRALLIGRRVDRPDKEQRPGPSDYSTDAVLALKGKRAAAALVVGRAREHDKEARHPQPGPNAYAPEASRGIGSTARAFTLTGRVEQKLAAADTPAPGQYAVLPTAPSGGAARIVSRRYERAEKAGPGPGRYTGGDGAELGTDTRRGISILGRREHADERAKIGPGPGKYVGETAMPRRGPAATLLGRPEERRCFRRRKKQKKEDDGAGDGKHGRVAFDSDDEAGWWTEQGPGPAAYNLAEATDRERTRGAAILLGRPKERRVPLAPGPADYAAASAGDRAQGRGAVSFGKPPPREEQPRDTGPAPWDYDTTAAPAAAAKAGAIITGRPKTPRKLETPGPQYAPDPTQTRVGPSFTFTGRGWNEQKVEGPGPAKYSAADIEAEKAKKSMAGPRILGRPKEKPPGHPRHRMRPKPAHPSSSSSSSSSLGSF